MVFKFMPILAIGFAACAGPKTIKQPQAESWDLEFQDRPLSTRDVRTAIAERNTSLGACFQREKLSSDVLSSFVFELLIPNNGAPHEIVLVRTSVPEQEILSECVQAELKKLKFLPHAGPSLRLKVPIEAPTRGD